MSSCTFTKYCNQIWVTTKVSNVLMNPLECHLLVLQPKISWGKKKSSEGGQDLRFALHTTVVVKWYFHVSKLFDFWKCILGQFLTQSFDQLLINSFGNLTSFQPVVSSMQRSEYRQAIMNCDNYNITEVCQRSSVVGLGVSRVCKHAYKCSTMNPNLKPTEKPKERLDLSRLPSVMHFHDLFWTQWQRYR